MREIVFEFLYINNKNHKIKSVSGLKRPNYKFLHTKVQSKQCTAACNTNKNP
jgi:hypothetical protein